MKNINENMKAAINDYLNNHSLEYIVETHEIDENEFVSLISENSIKNLERIVINENKISDEFERLSLLASGKANANFKEAFQMGVAGGTDTSGSAFGHGKGRTVNTIADDMYGPENSARPQKQPLHPEEALEVSIKRTLKSGAPVNNIAFYDEVNWNLMQLGFPGKNPIDIKGILLGLIEK